MASRLTDNICELLGQLITQVSGFDETSEHFKTIQDFAFSHVACPDYYFNQNRRDLTRIINNLSEKFQFHGFLRQADELKTLVNKFFDISPSREDLEIRLAILKLLLDLSVSPTTNFIEHPEILQPIQLVEEDTITDWASYLNDTKVKPIEYFSDSSEEWSELSDVSDEESKISLKEFDEPDSLSKLTTSNLSSYKPNIQNEAKLAKDRLFQTIQSQWWNREKISILPASNVEESNIAIQWDEFVDNVTMGLVDHKTNIIPEYKIMRELLWQFFVPNICFSFGFENNRIVPKSGMSISSARTTSFQYFLHEFVPYFEMLEQFKSFQNNLRGEYFISAVPDTYRSYSCSLEEIIEPVFEKIRDIENRVRKQESPMTILTIASELRPFFKDVELLYYIHSNLLKGFIVDNGFRNATYLLSRLYYGLLNSSDLTQQNLYLTLYLQSLYKYFTVIEIWLTQDMLTNETDEFIIIDKNPKDYLGSHDNTSTKQLSKTNNRDFQSQDWQMQYLVREMDDFSKKDGMLRIICTRIVQLGKNIHLLRLLGKLHLVIDEYATFKESLHEEFIRKILEEATNYTTRDSTNLAEAQTLTKDEPQIVEDKFAILCPDQKTSTSGMDSIENFLDFSDGFLATVFENCLHQEKDERPEKQKTLSEQINLKITKMFSVKQILESTFTNVLKTRYSVPGLMVKTILINQYQLTKYFGLMKHLYLFEDDIIFPFYKKIFAQFEKQQMWGNFFWLTSQLQDLLMDQYSEFYEDIRVDVDPNWRLCTNPITACDMVTVHCRINWPVNIIIRTEHIIKYHQVFQFILKIKWAMNTLNRLSFADIEPRNKPFKQQPPLIKERIRKLESMKFLLLNDVCSIQHYVLGHLFTRLWKRFDDDLNDSYDLETLINAHNKFIYRIHTFCVKLRDEMSEIHGFGKLLSLVAHLHTMWHDLNNLDDVLLQNCELDYRRCHKFLRPIIEINVAFV